MTLAPVLLTNRKHNWRQAWFMLEHCCPQASHSPALPGMEQLPHRAGHEGLVGDITPAKLQLCPAQSRGAVLRQLHLQRGRLPCVGTHGVAWGGRPGDLLWHPGDTAFPRAELGWVFPTQVLRFYLLDSGTGPALPTRLQSHVPKGHSHSWHSRYPRDKKQGLNAGWW